MGTRGMALLFLNLGARWGSSYNFVAAGCVEYYAYYHIPNKRIQLVRNAPDDGPLRSETCRANTRDE